MSLNENERWKELDLLFTRQGSIVGQNFAPNPETRAIIAEHVNVLCVGAGGLGCELLKDLALSGFVNIHVIDMDTIDVSNLNRQFLFRMEDVGKPKAVVAAKRVNERVPSAKVMPHFCRIEEKGTEFYEQFHFVVLGLDSIEARRYMNTVICGFLKYDEDGNPDPASVKPIIDGGTEGFKGHARVILPGTTPCFECTLWLFPPQIKFPLCTLAETPRTPAHCIAYAHIHSWKSRSETFDSDNEEHMKWIYQKAAERAELFGIQGVTYQLTQGVVKNIIPAIASTNAIVSAACTLEALKVLTGCSSKMDNYMMYNGGDGVYTQTVPYERDPDCLVCSSGVPITINPSITLQQFIDQLVADSRFSDKLSAPSVFYEAKRLYARGVFESATRPNLEKQMSGLVANSNSVLDVNDSKLSHTLRVRVLYETGKDADMAVG